MISYLKNRYQPLLLVLVLCMLSLVTWKIFFQCGDQIIANSIVVNPDPENSLRVNISFQTTNQSDAYIKYWRPSNKEFVQYSKKININKSHEITLIDLVQDERYNFQIVTIHEGCKQTSQLQSFTTGKIPINLTPLFWHEKPEKNFQGYILTQRRTLKGNVFIINREGRVVWYHKIDGMVKVTNWTVNNTILILYGNSEHKNSAGDNILEVDLEGNTLLHLKLGEGDFKNIVHHEVIANKDGNVLALIYNNRAFNLSSYGGSTSEKVTGDGLVLLDRKGNQLWKWSVFDVKNPLNDSSVMAKKDDWGHANAVCIDSDGNYLISFRDWNQIWKIDATSGRVIWTLGENGSIKVDEKYQFSGQHSIHINKNGDYMLFDNGLKNRQSRALAFSINKELKKAKLTMEVKFQEELYADRMGSVYLLENERILLCSPRSQSLVIANLSGDIISHADLGKPDPYRADYIKELYILNYKP